MSPAAENDGLPKVAAVTMTYNEPLFLPIWLRHYARQVGRRNCFVIDHGSDDGSTERLGDVNLIRLPRSPLDEFQRARFISGLCSSLLEYYHWVIHTDTDEIAFADPALHHNLRRYCAAPLHPQISAYGFNLIHAEEEPALNSALPILKQRAWFSFTTAVSKPVLTRRKTMWCEGFHFADAPVQFGDLYLIHLRYMDKTIALRRLAKTRAQAFVGIETNSHQRQDDAAQIRFLDFLSSRPRNDQVQVDPDSPELQAAVAASFGPPGGAAKYEMSNDPHQLWRVPTRFQHLF